MAERPISYGECQRQLPTMLEILKDAVSSLDLKLSDRSPLRWTEGIPNTDEAGVYLIFGSNEQLLYVGKAERPLGFEVWTKFVRGESDDMLLWKEGPTDQEQPSAIATIPIPDASKYLAPALEGLLIREFHPPLSTIGKDSGE